MRSTEKAYKLLFVLSSTASTILQDFVNLYNTTHTFFKTHVNSNRYYNQSEINICFYFQYRDDDLQYKDDTERLQKTNAK